MTDVPVKRGPGRPRKERPPVEAAPPMPDWQDFRRPVTVTFLMDVFGMDRRIIKHRLLNLAPIGNAQGNNPLYDFRQAAAYLVKPVGNLAEQLKSFRVQDLPSHLQAPYWDAMLKRQKYEQVAGNLWRTEDVLDVLGEVFMRIRDSLQLWPETLAESTDLSDEQRAILIQMVDGLQTEIHGKLVDLPKKRQTVSLAGRLAEDEGMLLDDDTDTEDEDLVG